MISFADIVRGSEIILFNSIVNSVRLPGEYKKPFIPFFIISSGPDSQSELMHGMPYDIASSNVIGNPSKDDVSNNALTYFISFFTRAQGSDCQPCQVI